MSGYDDTPCFHMFEPDYDESLPWCCVWCGALPGDDDGGDYDDN